MRHILEGEELGLTCFQTLIVSRLAGWLAGCTRAWMGTWGNEDPRGRRRLNVGDDYEKGKGGTWSSP